MDEKYFEDDLKKGVARLDKQVHEIQNKFALNHNAEKKLKNIQVCIMAAMLLLIGSFIFALYKTVARFDIVKTQGLMLQKIRVGLPFYTKRIVGMSSRLTPIYIDQIKTKAEEALPRFLSVGGGEIDKFISHIEENIENKINRELFNILQSQEDFIYTLVPELRNESNALLLKQNIKKLLTEALLDQMMCKFEEPIKAISNINITIDKFRKQPRGKEESQPELKLVATTLELLGKKLSREIEKEEKEEKIGRRNYGRRKKN